jgi:hypothetical protein
VNAKTQYIEGLRQLAANIKAIEFFHTAFVYAGRHAMNEGRSFFEAKDHPDVKAWRQFKDDIVGELDAAIKVGLQDYEFVLASCRKLSIELSQGFYKDGSPLIFESITEVTALADKIEYSAKTKGSEADGSPRTEVLHPWVALANESGGKTRRQRAMYVFSKLDGNKQKALLAEFKKCLEYCGKVYSTPRECVIAKIMRSLERKNA